MKVTITIALCAFFAISVISCNREKNWTCVCQTSTTPMNYPINDASKKDARQECDDRVVGIALSCDLED
jgi:hypothetical protein